MKSGTGGGLTRLPVAACSGGDMRHSAKRLALALLGIGLATTTLRGQVTLEPGSNLPAVLADGQSHEYRLHLRAGAYARVVVEQHSVDISITCLDPAGNELFALDSSVI